MLFGFGDVHTYYNDQPPSQATLDMIAAMGDTVQMVPRTAGVAYNEQGAAVPAAGSAYATDPYLMGGGNPLYSNPANIPPPPMPQYEQCIPLDTACVNRNTAREAEWGDVLWPAYNKALQGAVNPHAPDEYMALLAKYQIGAIVAPGVTSGGFTPGAGPSAGPGAGPTGIMTPRTPAVAPLPPSSQTDLNLQMAGPDPRPIQPTVSAGGQAQAVPLSTSVPASSPVPSWVWMAAAAGGAFLLLGGRPR